MTQPQDPTQGLDQQAIDAALDEYNTALTQYNTAADRLNSVVDTGTANEVSSATQQADNARTQLAAAGRAYSTLLGRVATQRETMARAAKDPNEQRLWLNEADKAQSQSDLYKAESSLYGAKTDADIAKAQAESQAAMSRAASVANRVQSQNDANQAQALLARTKAAQVPALTQSTIDLHNSTIQKNSAYVNYLNSRAAVGGSQVDLNEARAALISGPQAQSMLSKSELDQARANKLDLTNGATLADLQAKAGLSNARVQQIYANIGKSQVLPYADVNAPTVDIFNPFTGSLTGQQNPAYKNPYSQPITDRAAAIDAIRNDLAAGKFGQGQQAVDYANQLIDGISQAALYQAQGYTPQQYQQLLLQQQQQQAQQQQGQAQIGMDVLNNYMGTLNKGQDAANQFLSAARGVRNLPAGMQLTPFSTFGKIADLVYGPSLSKAQSLINQLQPVTDRTSAMQAFSQLAGIKQHLLDTAQQSGQTQPTPTTADQATNAGINQANNATAAAGGTPNMPTPFAQSGLPEGRSVNDQNDPALLQMAMLAGLGAQP